MEIVFFNNKTQKFFESLDKQVRPRTVRTFELLEQYGNHLGMPHSKALGGGLFELRIVGLTHIRFIYTFYKNKIWMLHACVKKTNRLPKSDLDYARKQLTQLLP